MTHDQWRQDATLAAQLKQVLSMPIIEAAISVLNEQTMAKTLGTSNGLLALADKATVLFGYDAGRASLIADLHNLSIVPEEIENIEPSYVGEF